MFKSTRLSAILAAFVVSVSAAAAFALPQTAFAQSASTEAAPAATAPAEAAPAASAAAPAAPAAPAADPAASAPAAAASGPASAEASKEEVHNPFSPEEAIRKGDFVAKSTFVILLLMSLGSWYIIIIKLIDQTKVMKQAKEVRNKFWKTASIKEGTAALEVGSPFHFISETGLKASAHHEGALLEQIDLNTWVTMSIDRAVGKVQSRLQDGLSFLATVGSTSPFIGLFGTVWGIYGALTKIGMSGQASIDKVAGPVGEALIMTAFGLFVAVPAVLGYNWLVRRNKSVMEDVRAFSADVHMVLMSGAMHTSEAARSASGPAKKNG